MSRDRWLDQPWESHVDRQDRAADRAERTCIVCLVTYDRALDDYVCTTCKEAEAAAQQEETRRAA